MKVCGLCTEALAGSKEVTQDYTSVMSANKEKAELLGGQGNGYFKSNG